MVVFLGRNGKGEVSSLGLVSLSNFFRLQVMGVVPSCLVPGHGLVEGMSGRDLVCES